MSQINELLTIAKERIHRFCMMIWDYYLSPNLFRYAITNRSTICMYENHLLLHGEPDSSLLSSFLPSSGIQISIAFDIKWKETIEKLCKKLQPIEANTVLDKKRTYNHFMCMELNKELFNSFISSSSFSYNKSVELSIQSHSNLLSIDQSIWLQHGIGMGIIKDNKLVATGFIPHIVVNSNFSFGVIRSVWVDNNWRKKGLGTDIIVNLCKKALSRNIQGIILWVEKDNSAAINLYKKLGFEIKDEVYSWICQTK